MDGVDVCQFSEKEVLSLKGFSDRGKHKTQNTTDLGLLQ